MEFSCVATRTLGLATRRLAVVAVAAFSAAALSAIWSRLAAPPACESPSQRTGPPPPTLGSTTAARADDDELASFLELEARLRAEEARDSVQRRGAHADGLAGLVQPNSSSQSLPSSGWSRRSSHASLDLPSPPRTPNSAARPPGGCTGGLHHAWARAPRGLRFDQGCGLVKDRCRRCGRERYSSGERAGSSPITPRSVSPYSLSSITSSWPSECDLRPAFPACFSADDAER